MFRWMKGEVGVTLVSVMLILLLMTLLGAGLLTSALSENKIIHNLEDQKQALYLAQAGIEYARFELQKDLTWRTGGMTQLLGRGQFVLNVSEDGEERVKIRSAGTVGRQSKTLEVGASYTQAIPLVEQMAEYMVIGGGNLTFSNNTTFYNGNLRSNGDITGISSIVNGEVIASGEVSGSVDGTLVSEGEDMFPVPDVDWAALENLALTDGRYLTSFDESSLRNNVVNYINKDVYIDKKGLDFVLDGILVIRGDFIVDTKTEILSNTGLMIFVDGSVSFENRSEIHAAIYATESIHFRNLTYFEGALYTPGTVSATNHTEITLSPQHLYQPLVSEVLIPTGTGTGGGAEMDRSLTILYWNEL